MVGENAEDEGRTGPWRNVEDPEMPMSPKVKKTRATDATPACLLGMLLRMA
jgi:hypothetical protein